MEGLIYLAMLVYLVLDMWLRVSALGPRVETQSWFAAATMVEAGPGGRAIAGEGRWEERKELRWWTGMGRSVARERTRAECWLREGENLYEREIRTETAHERCTSLSLSLFNRRMPEETALRKKKKKNAAPSAIHRRVHMQKCAHV